MLNFLTGPMFAVGVSESRSTSPDRNDADDSGATFGTDSDFVSRPAAQPAATID